MKSLAGGNAADAVAELDHDVTASQSIALPFFSPSNSEYGGSVVAVSQAPGWCPGPGRSCRFTWSFMI